MILDNDLIQKINFFEKLTKVKVKDVFRFDSLWIIVGFGGIGKAIGKKGANIKKFSELVNERVKIIEFNKEPTMFLRNIMMPLKLEKVQMIDGKIEIETDRKTKGLLMGKNQKNLKDYSKVFNKYFKYELIIK
jgi:N utilization substance protein A